MLGLIAFAGAVVGSLMGYVGTFGATRTERRARHREVWGRRFTHALEMSLSANPLARRAGMALLGLLGTSELASTEERGYVRTVLATASVADREARLRRIVDGIEGE